MDLADAKGDQMYPLTPDLIDARGLRATVSIRWMS